MAALRLYYKFFLTHNEPCFINTANGLFSYHEISRQTIIFWSKFCEKSGSDSAISMI